MFFDPYSLIFIFFAALLVFAAIMVVCSRNPVTSALYLVYAFFNAAIIWMLLYSEFLSLVLIFVYVGAVMTLFLFVVMMLNIDTAVLRQGFVRYLPLGVIVLALMAGGIIVAVRPLQYVNTAASQTLASTNNIHAIGIALFSRQMVYPFELAGVLLLSAIISAIMLTHRSKITRKVQNIPSQLAATKANRLTIVSLPSKPNHGEESLP